MKLLRRACEITCTPNNSIRIRFSGLMETAKSIKEAGGKCWLYKCDVTDREEVYQTAKAVKLEAGNVKFFIFCRRFKNVFYLHSR